MTFFFKSIGLKIAIFVEAPFLGFPEETKEPLIVTKGHWFGDSFSCYCIILLLYTHQFGKRKKGGS